MLWKGGCSPGAPPPPPYCPQLFPWWAAWLELGSGLQHPLSTSQIWDSPHLLPHPHYIRRTGPDFWRPSEDVYPGVLLPCHPVPPGSPKWWWQCPGPICRVVALLLATASTYPGGHTERSLQQHASSGGSPVPFHGPQPLPWPSLTSGPFALTRQGGLGAGLAACPNPLPSCCRPGTLPRRAQPAAPHPWVLGDRAPVGFVHLPPWVSAAGGPFAVMPGSVAASG